MIEKHLHIISLDIPYPADYGGIVDIFYKLKALNKIGIKIHLHCFTKSRLPQIELNKYCETVHYYKRKNELFSLFFLRPFIVSSRKNKELLNNLSKDNYPILIEGVHCAYYLNNNKLNNRKIVLRIHNTEFEYYKQLVKNEIHFFKKIYYFFESKLLFRFEKRIANKAIIAALSNTDINNFITKFNAKKIFFLPAFIENNKINIKDGLGNYCLYQGNLSINENENVAIWLIENIFSKINQPLIIAGKNPSKLLGNLILKKNNIRLIANPSALEMNELISNAHINVIPSFNNTGVKLKLLNALFNGRHCIVNAASIAGSQLDTVCHLANSAIEFKNLIEKLMPLPITLNELEQRDLLLNSIYNNKKNAINLTNLLW